MTNEQDDYPDCKEFPYIDPDEGIHDEFLKKKREAINREKSNAKARKWYHENKSRLVIKEVTE